MLPHTYITQDGTPLDYDIFYPTHLPSNLPSLILFFGGAWAFGGRHKFYPQAEYFAKQGYVVFTPDYRVLSRQHVSPKTCVADALAFWAHIREHAAEFGISPDRIALGGGSSGGHLALMAGLRGDALPKAFVLFNPVVTLPSKKLSPARLLGEDFPPALILHGSRDVLIPLPIIRRFISRVQKLGNDVLLFVYPKRGHGFFRLDRGNEAFADTNEKVAQFLKKYV